MAWASVQFTPGSGNVNHDFLVSTLALTTFGTQVALNDFVIVHAFGDPTNGDWTVSDNATSPNTYTRVYSAKIGTFVSQGFIAQILSLPGSGNLAPVVTGGTNSEINACAQELSGGSLNTNGTTSATGNSGTSGSPGSLTPTFVGDLAITGFTPFNATLSSITIPTGFSTVGTVLNGANGTGGGAAYQILSGMPTVNPTWNWGPSESWAMAVALLQQANPPTLASNNALYTNNIPPPLPNSIPSGTFVAWTLAVNPATDSSPSPTGTIQFLVDGVSLGSGISLVGRSATSVYTNTLSPGTHTITATYTGDSNYIPTTNTLIVLASLPNVAVAGSQERAYAAAVTFSPAQTSATDILALIGSSSQVVRLTRMSVSGQSSTATNVAASLIYRSANDTSGAPSAATAVAYDPNSVNATATVNYFTASNPTALGSAVGTVRTGHFLTGTTAAVQDRLVWTFNEAEAEPLLLRTASQIVALNLGAVTPPAGLALDVWLEWTEQES